MKIKRILNHKNTNNAKEFHSTFFQRLLTIVSSRISLKSFKIFGPCHIYNVLSNWSWLLADSISVRLISLTCFNYLPSPYRQQPDELCSWCHFEKNKAQKNWNFYFFCLFSTSEHHMTRTPERVAKINSMFTLMLSLVVWLLFSSAAAFLFCFSDAR